MRTVDEYIDAYYPKLGASSAKDMYVEDATRRTSESFFGEDYTYAIFLRAANDFAIDDTRPDKGSGLVTGRTEGKTSISYWNSVSASSGSDLHMTIYGKRLKALIASKGPNISIGATGVL